MRVSVVRFDAPFWVALLTGVIIVGSLACIGVAAAAQDASRGDSLLVSVDDT